MYRELHPLSVMKPLKPVKITRWVSESEQITYIFDSILDTSQPAPQALQVPQAKDKTIIIKENIYQDDNIEYAINKIAHYISPNTPYYAWNKSGAILFSIEKIKWKGYNVNPFKSKDRSSEELKEPITYKYNRGIFNSTHLNIVFLNDFKENNKYYFVPSKAATNIDRREAILKTLYNKQLAYTRILTEVYSRIDFCAELKNISNMASIFDRMHANNKMQLIQWCYDSSHIVYKLYKKHNLSDRFLNSAFNTDKIRNFNCIYIYSVLSNGTYCKICLNSNGLLILSYILDLRNSINWNDLIRNKNMIVKYLQDNLKQKIVLQELNINAKIYFNIDNSSFATLSKKVGEYIDIFHVGRLINEKNKNKILCIYKRSNNYNKEPIDLNEYIKSRLNLGINDKELIIELMNLGISQIDAENLIQIELTATANGVNGAQPQINVKIENTGTIVAIESYKQGYMVEISNCPSKKELSYLLYWLSRIIENTRKIVKKADVPVRAPVVIAAIAQSESSSSREDENIGNESFDLGSDDDFFKGGALGRQKHGYFMTLLKNADKDLFTDNYARKKCQAAFQPLVLSKQEKDDLQEKDMLKYFDNIIEYGSKPELKNFYTCPRIWCPVSKIPLDYNIDDPKCPIENEEPMKLYWNKDKTKPRFVKLTDADENGLSAPCCFKKEFTLKEKKTRANAPANPQTNSQANPIPQANPQTNTIPQANPQVKEPVEKDENYIMNKSAPIPANRFGLVPEKLYSILFPSVSYALCSKTLNKAEKCLIRHGIHHKSSKQNSKKDSIMHACAYLLGFNDKTSFIKDIRKRLDLLHFISLEDGNICKDFLDMTHIQNAKHILNVYKEDRHRTNKYFDDKLSNITTIYGAYLKFIEYLATDSYPDEKNPQYIFSLIALLYNTLLIIWEKQDNDINLICPYYTSYADILLGLDLNPKVMMILKEGLYYEPLEMKSRNEDSVKRILLTNLSNTEELFAECNKLTKKEESESAKNIFLLSQYAKSNLFAVSKKFFIESIIINSDLTIDTFITKSNIVLRTDKIPISLLPSIMKQLDAKHILFYDDIIGQEYKVSVLISDLNIFLDKCKENKIQAYIGKVIKQTEQELMSSFTIPSITIEDNMIIHNSKNNALHSNIEVNKRQSKKWFQLHKLVANKLLKVYNNDMLAQLSTKNRTEIIQQLLQHFLNIPIKDRRKIQIILEGLPIYTIDHIRNWYNNIIVYNKYQLFNREVQETPTEFIFTQYHIANKLPSKIIKYHATMPNRDFETFNSKQYVIKNNSINEDVLPIIFTGVPEKLKSKWTKHKKLIWDKMILRRTQYFKTIIPELFDWLVKRLGYNISYTKIEDLTRNKYFDALKNDEAMMELLSDPSFYGEYVAKMNKLHNTKKKFKTLQIFYDDYYADSSMKERDDIVEAVLNDGQLYPNDLNLLTMSEFLNISILIIHRTKYGKVADINVKRGELEDLLHSSTLFPAKNNIEDRPLLILGKEYDKYYCSYYAITEINKNIYIQYKDAPNDVKMLVEGHMK